MSMVRSTRRKRVLACAATAALACLLAAAVLTEAPLWSAPSGSRADMLTFHGDAARTGWNANERALTPTSVRSRGFGRLWSAPVDGAIYAEPLVAGDIAVRGIKRTAVYIVTERDLIYAFDAADGSRLWGPVSLGTPVPLASLPCGNIDPVGITSTPVIDRASSTLYVVGLTSPDGGLTKVYRLTALDLASGGVRPGYPVVIAPPATAGVRFDPGPQQQRGALALVQEAVYVPFGGYFGDCGDYHGWVVGVPTAQPDRQQAFVTPTHREGGIWAAGGLAADAAANLYAATGNSDSRGPVDLGNSVIRLATAPKLAFSGRAADFFAPSNFAALNETDTDLGSSAPLLLPRQEGSATPDLVFIAGKQGVGYLINREEMGGVSHGNGIEGEGVFSRCLFGDCRGGRPKVFSASAYWDGGTTGRFILVPGHGNQPGGCHGTGGVVALRLDVAPSTHASTFRIAWCSPSMGDPGAPAVSGVGPDGGLVWVVDSGSAVLFALDARTGKAIYQSGGKDALGSARRFITPAVSNGRVYIGAGEALVAYGIPKH
jgi:hypothetical protein